MVQKYILSFFFKAKEDNLTRKVKTFLIWWINRQFGDSTLNIKNESFNKKTQNSNIK
jgi:hypothetical protein